MATVGVKRLMMLASSRLESARDAVSEAHNHSIVE